MKREAIELAAIVLAEGVRQAPDVVSAVLDGPGLAEFRAWVASRPTANTPTRTKGAIERTKRRARGGT